MSRLAVAVALLALALPAVVLAAVPNGQDVENSTRSCKAQRLALGANAFRALYAPAGPASAALARCVARTARARAAHRVNASRTCRAEQNDPAFAGSHGGKTFAQFYGPGRNAFGKCVSMKAGAAADAQQRATVRAGVACRAELAADPAAFVAKYGAGRQKANAFGRCVARRTATP